MKLIYIIMFSFLFIGCNLNVVEKNQEKDKEEALVTINNLREYLKNDNYEDAVTLFLPQFFKAMPKEELIKLFDLRKEKLGKYIDSEIIKWDTTIKHGTNAKSEYNFIIDSKFSKSNVQQRISLEKDVNGKILIYGYYLVMPKK